jgi:hypothetical protein
VTDFLDEKRKEITVQMDKLKPLVEEYRRLEAAAAALRDIPSAPQGASIASARPVRARRRPGRPRGSARAAASQPAPASARSATSAKPTAKRRRGRRKRAGGRAEQALRSIRAEPGLTIPALAEKMGIDGTYLYKILPPLEQEGKIEKRGRGWHPKAA